MHGAFPIDASMLLTQCCPRLATVARLPCSFVRSLHTTSLAIWSFCEEPCRRPGLFLKGVRREIGWTFHRDRLLPARRRLVLEQVNPRHLVVILAMNATNGMLLLSGIRSH